MTNVIDKAATELWCSGNFIAKLKTKIAVLKINNSLTKNNRDDAGVVREGGATAAARRHEGKERW
jgi:hypothetical protein